MGAKLTSVPKGTPKRHRRGSAVDLLAQEMERISSKESDGQNVSVTLDKLVKWWEAGGQRQIADMIGIAKDERLSGLNLLSYLHKFHLDEREWTAAVRIQRYARGWRVRTELAPEIARIKAETKALHAAAARVQARARGKLSRQNLAAKQESALTLQTGAYPEKAYAIRTHRFTPAFGLICDSYLPRSRDACLARHAEGQSDQKGSRGQEEAARLTDHNFESSTAPTTGRLGL